MVVFKVFLTCKTILKVDIKLQIMPELISLWCLYYSVWTRFYLSVCTWRVRSSRPEQLYKKGVLKNPTKFLGKHLSLFFNKAAGWRPATSLNTESGTGAFLWILWNPYENISFANVYEGMPLKSKIFTGASFRKILVFY